ncbi:MAG: DUF1015 domain-containing protein [Candidatus Bipolaricaulota bacterium]|nr:MAG: DUF1015 domain-containing protein [Candidatus Bipolaricaulota bacterium]
MARIHAFRGVRFDPDVVGEISHVVTQPYDRIYPENQGRYYDASPHNIVRIVKGRGEPGDNGENIYRRAGATLREWRECGVLVRDDEPALYVYHQRYRFEGETLLRKGVIALGALEPERVHAHEKTLRGPKEDRLRLMRATEANFGHIFMLYTDPERRADRALDAAIAGCEPTIEARDEFGNDHLVWRVTDPEVIAEVAAALADKDLYIADGHHRYETAVTYMQECLDRGWAPAAAESFDVRMMTLFNLDEPGMSIRPIHRMIHGIDGFDLATFLAAAAEDFDVDELPSLEATRVKLAAERDRHSFGLYAEGRFSVLTLRDEAIMDERITGELSADWKRLDVSILHTAIFERLLGIDAVALEEQRNITYTVDADAGVTEVDRGEQQAFFLLNPTRADEVRRIADRGERMPQKSTDFYPKLLTGLVLSTMEIAK